MKHLLCFFKRKKVIHLVACTSLFLGFLLVSCSKSNDSLIKEYKDLCTQVEKAIKDGDITKAVSLAEKGDKIEKELSERTLTPEQQAQVLEITGELMMNSISNIMENSQQLTKELETMFE